MPSPEQRRPRDIPGPLRTVGRSSGLMRGTLESGKELLARRELLGLLVRRELRAKYKNSALGFAWSLMRPLAQLLVYYIAIGQFLGAARQIPDFAIFVFAGLTIWTLYSEILSAGTTSVVNNAGLVKKIYLPREIFPLGAVGGAIINFAIQFGILLIATIVLGRAPVHPEALYAVASFLLIVVIGTACALVLSAVNVYLRDVEHLIEVALLILFWASPIVYAHRFVDEVITAPWLQELYLANPVTIAVIGMQKAMWTAGSAPDSGQVWPDNLEWRFAIATFVSLFLVWGAQRVFSRLQGNFAQEL